MCITSKCPVEISPHKIGACIYVRRGEEHASEALFVFWLVYVLSTDEQLRFLRQFVAYMYGFLFLQPGQSMFGVTPLSHLVKG